jgi:hypothetical protein
MMYPLEQSVPLDYGIRDFNFSLRDLGEGLLRWTAYEWNSHQRNLMNVPEKLRANYQPPKPKPYVPLAESSDEDAWPLS